MRKEQKSGVVESESKTKSNRVISSSSDQKNQNQKALHFSLSLWLSLLFSSLLVSLPGNLPPSSSDINFIVEIIQPYPFCWCSIKVDSFNTLVLIYGSIKGLECADLGLIWWRKGGAWDLSQSALRIGHCNLSQVALVWSIEVLLRSDYGWHWWWCSWDGL